MNELLSILQSPESLCLISAILLFLILFALANLDEYINGKDLKDPIKIVTFFKDKRELRKIQNESASSFHSYLEDVCGSAIFFLPQHIYGTALTAYYYFDDKEKALAYLNILKEYEGFSSENSTNTKQFIYESTMKYEKSLGFKTGDLYQQVNLTIAFLIKKDGYKIEDFEEFIEFSKSNGLVIDKGLVEEYIKTKFK